MLGKLKNFLYIVTNFIKTGSGRGFNHILKELQDFQENNCKYYDSIFLSFLSQANTISLSVYKGGDSCFITVSRYDGEITISKFGKTDKRMDELKNKLELLK